MGLAMERLFSSENSSVHLDLKCSPRSHGAERIVHSSACRYRIRLGVPKHYRCNSNEHGKSMIFAIPALMPCVETKTPLRFFSIHKKSLANDQLSKAPLPDGSGTATCRTASNQTVLAVRYDGGVPSEDRKTIRDQVQLLLTNPDMLHLGILQHHEIGWARFFANLKTVRD